MSRTEESSENAEIFHKNYPLVYIRGLPMPSPLLDVPTVESAMDFKPADSDIFVTTYPKCGTTWMQFLVWEVLNKGAAPPTPNQMMFQHCPFLEFSGINDLPELKPPRVMKTHLPFNLHPYNPKSKYIYVIRNPFDVCVSYHHHHCMDPIMPKVKFNDYFELFLTGELGWGSFFEHIKSWALHKNDSNVLFLAYEDMKKDTKDVLYKIAKFLGDEYYQDLLDPEVMQNCLKHTDFKYLKQLGMFFPHMPENVTNEESIAIMKEMGKMDRELAKKCNFKEVEFFRKGQVGDWRNHLSDDQVDRLNKCMIDNLKGTELEGFWKPVVTETTL